MYVCIYTHVLDVVAEVAGAQLHDEVEDAVLDVDLVHRHDVRVPQPARKVDVRLPGKRNSNSHGARPVHLIITIIKWTRTSRLSIKKTPSFTWISFVNTMFGCRNLREFSIREQLLHRNVQRFRGGLVFKAHRLLYHSTLGLRVIKKMSNLTEGVAFEPLSSEYMTVKTRFWPWFQGESPQNVLSGSLFARKRFDVDLVHRYHVRVPLPGRWGCEGRVLDGPASGGKGSKGMN